MEAKDYGGKTNLQDKMFEESTSNTAKVRETPERSSSETSLKLNESSVDFLGGSLMKFLDKRE